MFVGQESDTEPMRSSAVSLTLRLPPESRLSRVSLLLAMGVVLACSGDDEPDAYGNFEAIEVVVSAQTSGQLQWFTPVEGARLSERENVGLVDTTQLSLQEAQMVAQRGATTTRVREAEAQVRVLEAQVEVARRAFERTQRLFRQKAATAHQLDQAERDYRTLVAQIRAGNAHRQTIERDAVSSDATVAQIRDRVTKSAIINPRAGTVLSIFARTGEVVQSGQPLYKIANLDTLTLRAYVGEEQLRTVRLGQPVKVNIDQGGGRVSAATGHITWIASAAEFTPTPVQTRDERANLVYAVKISVPNPRGELKIGMPADVDIAVPSPRT